MAEYNVVTIPFTLDDDYNINIIIPTRFITLGVKKKLPK